MRSACLVLCVVVVGCSGSPGPSDAGGQDAGLDAGVDAGTDAGLDAGVDAGIDAGLSDGGAPDAGSDAGVLDAGMDGGSVDAGVDAGNPLAFTITVPAFSVDAGTQTAFCYHFRTANAAEVAVKSWRSRSTASVHYLSLWLSNTALADAGTFTTTDCAQDPGKASWAYSAWEPDAGWSFPADDGAGHPLAKVIAPGTSGYLYLVVTNPTSGALDSSAELEVGLYPVDAGVTRADSLVAYNANLNIPASGSTTASATCPLPTSTKFTWLSVFTHKQGTRARVFDGATTLFDGNDWEHPGASTWAAPAFPAPTAGAQYACDYVNPTNRVIHTGASLELDEQCLMLSYVFPTSVPRLCVNSTLLP